MVDSVALFQCFRPSVTATTLRQLRRIIPALLVITGRLTLLGLSRWTGTGGSYRTVQRFFSTVIPWAMRLWVFFRPHVYCPQEVSLLAGDEVVVPKAGTTTHGLERCFSRLAGQPVPGLACFTLSLVRGQARRSFPLRVDQVVRSAAEKATSKATAEAKQAKAPRAPHRLGRPPGHTNTPTAHVTLTPELRRLNAMIEALLPLIARVIPLTSLVLDGHFGHHNALSLAPQSNLPRIATRRGDAALSFPSTGPSAGRGPRRK
jgi:putative transposase